MDYAFLSHIDVEDETERFEAVYGSHDSIEAGTSVPLSKTYCRKTISEPEGTMVVNDALAEGWEDDPAYDTFELGSYLGTTVWVDGEFYGTLCYADTSARDEPLSDKAKGIIELQSRMGGYILTVRDEPLFRETRLDTIEERAVSSKAIDSMMDALRNPTRRVILMSLLDTPGISLGTLEGRVNAQNTRIGLIQSDLPKLADYGYIKWDRETETVSKGPKFSEVEPLVQLLKEYNAGFSE